MFLQNLGSMLRRRAGLIAIAVVLTPVAAVAALAVADGFDSNLATAGLIALGVGLVIGLLGAFVADRFDARIYTSRDLAAAAGVTTLTVVPSTRSPLARSRRVATLETPDSPVAERYRTLLAAIDFAQSEHDTPVILVSSARPGERKTTTAANLAVVAANSGRRVVLLDADLRAPQLHRLFGAPLEPGLSAIIDRSVRLSECAQTVDGAPTLRMVAAGPLPARPHDVLDDERMADVIDEMVNAADLVVIDSAPVLAAADAALLMPHVTGTLVVATARSSNAREVRRVVEQLQTVGADIVGTVLHQPDAGADGSELVSYGSPTRRTMAATPRAWFVSESSTGSSGTRELPTESSAPAPAAESVDVPAPAAHDEGGDDFWSTASSAATTSAIERDTDAADEPTDDLDADATNDAAS